MLLNSEKSSLVIFSKMPDKLMLGYTFYYFRNYVLLVILLKYLLVFLG